MFIKKRPNVFLTLDTQSPHKIIITITKSNTFSKSKLPVLHSFDPLLDISYCIVLHSGYSVFFQDPVSFRMPND